MRSVRLDQYGLIDADAAKVLANTKGGGGGIQYNLTLSGIHTLSDEAAAELTNAGISYADSGQKMETLIKELKHTLKLQVLGTDEARELIITGKATNPRRICSEGPEEAECRAQTLTAVIKKSKSGTWRGTMAYFILRQGKYRHGVAERVVIKPKRRR